MLFWLINVIAFGFGFSTFPRASCLGWQTGFTKTYTCGWLALKAKGSDFQLTSVVFAATYHRGYPTSQSMCSPSNQNWYCTPRNNAKDCTLWAPSSYKYRVKQLHHLSMTTGVSLIHREEGWDLFLGREIFHVLRRFVVTGISGWCLDKAYGISKGMDTPPDILFRSDDAFTPRWSQPANWEPWRLLQLWKAKWVFQGTALCKSLSGRRTFGWGRRLLMSRPVRLTGHASYATIQGHL